MSHSSAAARAMDPRKIAARNKKKANRSSLAIGSGPKRGRRKQPAVPKRDPRSGRANDATSQSVLGSLLSQVSTNRKERGKADSSAAEHFDPSFSHSVSGKGLGVSPSNSSRSNAHDHADGLAHTAPLQRDVPASMRSSRAQQHVDERAAPNPWGKVPSNAAHAVHEVYQVDATGRMSSGPVRSRPSSRRARPTSSSSRGGGPTAHQGLSITSQSLSSPGRMKPPHRVDPIPHPPPPLQHQHHASVSSSFAPGVGGGASGVDERALKQQKQEALKAALAEQMREKRRRMELEQQMEREREEALQNPWSSPSRPPQTASHANGSVRHVSTPNAARHSTTAFRPQQNTRSHTVAGHLPAHHELNASFMAHAADSSSTLPAQASGLDGASIAHLNKQGYMHIDEKERKRMQQLAQQEAIRQQIEEKKLERQRRLEEEQQEERRELERIQRDQERLQQQYEEEQAARRKKEEDQRKRLEAVQAMKEADEAGRRERQRALREERRRQAQQQQQQQQQHEGETQMRQQEPQRAHEEQQQQPQEQQTQGAQHTVEQQGAASASSQGAERSDGHQQRRQQQQRIADAQRRAKQEETASPEEMAERHRVEEEQRAFLQELEYAEDRNAFGRAAAGDGKGYGEADDGVVHSASPPIPTLAHMQAQDQDSGGQDASRVARSKSEGSQQASLSGHAMRHRPRPPSVPKQNGGGSGRASRARKRSGLPRSATLLRNGPNRASAAFAAPASMAEGDDAEAAPVLSADEGQTQAGESDGATPANVRGIGRAPRNTTRRHSAGKDNSSTETSAAGRTGGVGPGGDQSEHSDDGSGHELLSESLQMPLGTALASTEGQGASAPGGEGNTESAVSEARGAAGFVHQRSYSRVSAVSVAVQTDHSGPIGWVQESHAVGADEAQGTTALTSVGTERAAVSSCVASVGAVDAEEQEGKEVEEESEGEHADAAVKESLEAAAKLSSLQQMRTILRQRRRLFASLLA